MLLEDKSTRDTIVSYSFLLVGGDGKPEEEQSLLPQRFR